jgi:hypothetical protein
MEKQYVSDTGQSGKRRENKTGRSVYDEEAMLDRDAKALGVSREELLSLLTRQQALRKQFEAALAACRTY